MEIKIKNELAEFFNYFDEEPKTNYCDVVYTQISDSLYLLEWENKHGVHFARITKYPTFTECDTDFGTMAEKKFNRKKYYSQTEACETFGLSIKEFKRLVRDYSLPIINHNVSHGFYDTVAIYVLRTDLEFALSQESK